MNFLKGTALTAALTMTFAFLAFSSARAQDPNAAASNRAERPVPPIVAAIDANKDGEIDAAEIANAVAALKSLDKNGDGKLSGDEIRPPRRDGGHGAGGPPKGGRHGREKAEGQ